MLKNRKLIICLLIVAMMFGTLSIFAAAQDKPVIGVSIPAFGNPFWERVVTFTKVIAEQLDVDLKIVDCRENEAQQILDIENLIAAGVKGLVVTPQTGVVGPKIIALAEEADVPIVITDRWPNVDPSTHPWAGFVGFIGPDDEDTGYNIAKALIEEAGVTNLVSLSGLHGLSVTEGRFAGLQKALKEHPEVKLLDTQWIGETGVNALEVTENYLAAYPDQFDGIWCDADVRAVGAVKALIDAGKAGDIKVAAMDLNSDAIDYIADGKMFASFGGHWLQDGFGLIMVYDYINGIPPKPEYRVAKLKLMKVVAADVDRFNDQFVTNPPEIDATKISKVLNPAASGSYSFEIKLK